MVAKERARPRALAVLYLLLVVAAVELCRRPLLLASPQQHQANSIKGDSSAAYSRSPYVSLCVAVKDEHDDLPEWVEHHLGLGVGKIYIVDQGSSPPLSAVLGSYIAEGAVEYTWLEGIPQPLAAMYSRQGLPTFQPYAYDYCMERYRTRHTWMGIIDADEYVVLRPDIPDLPTLLKRYEAFGGLCAFWRIVGSSGHRKRPPGGVRASYTNCQPTSSNTSRVVKTFVNLRDVLPTLGQAGPHAFQYRDDKYAVDSKFKRIIGRGRVPVHDEIEVYHFMLRSLEDFRKKMQRGNGMGWARNESYFAEVDAECTEECIGALRYVASGVG